MTNHCWTDVVERTSSQRGDENPQDSAGTRQPTIATSTCSEHFRALSDLVSLAILSAHHSSPLSRFAPQVAYQTLSSYPGTVSGVAMKW